jgi:hypothetical protein
MMTLGPDPVKIAKDFFTAKDFRTYAMNFLHQEKSFRDHSGELPRTLSSHVARAYRGITCIPSRAASRGPPLQLSGPALAAYLRPGEPLRLVPGVPARMAARLAVLWQRAAGPYGTRPAASQWSMALSNRDEIPMRVPGPVRERYPSMISKAELQPDSNTSRPVIPMSPPQVPGPPAPQSPQPTRPTITFRPPSQQPGAQP